MVYCHVTTTYLNPIDATETRVVDRGFGNKNEIRILACWRHWLEKDPNSIVASQSFGAALGHQKRKGSSIRTMVYKM